MYIVWDKKFSVEINEMDEQHKVLIGIINELDSIFEKNGIDFDCEIKKVMTDLEKYTVRHFTDEENLMKQSGYEDLDIHKEGHDNFIKLVGEQKSKINSLIEQKNKTKQLDKVDDFNKEIYKRVEKTLIFLQKWLLSHIMKSDKGYMDCVLKNIK